MTPVVLFSCDAWKSNDSMRMIGVFTNRKKLNSILNKMLKDENIELGLDKKIKDYSIKELQVNVDFIYVQEVDFNKADY